VLPCKKFETVKALKAENSGINNGDSSALWTIHQEKEKENFLLYKYPQEANS
jgi:hypothetical protein